jgi:hypothetical protein
MVARTQSIEDLLYLLTLLVVIGLVAGVVCALYVLGNLPGRIARDREHPRARAISVCGWLGLLTIVLWPVALAWAYVMPKKKNYQHLRVLSDEDVNALALCGDEVDALVQDLREASKQVAAIKNRLAALSSSKRVA